MVAGDGGHIPPGRRPSGGRSHPRPGHRESALRAWVQLGRARGACHFAQRGVLWIGARQRRARQILLPPQQRLGAPAGMSGNSPFRGTPVCIRKARTHHVRARASCLFSAQWLALVHKDDEHEHHHHPEQDLTQLCQHRANHCQCTAVGVRLPRLCLHIDMTLWRVP